MSDNPNLTKEPLVEPAVEDQVVPVKNEKLYTEEEASKKTSQTVRERLASQKKTFDETVAAKDEALGSISSQLDTANQTITKLIAKQLEGLPEGVKEAVLGLEPTKQYEWLEKYGGKPITKVPLPEVPEEFVGKSKSDARKIGVKKL